MNAKIAKFFATCAGVGYAPFGPGTFGSLVALIWIGLTYARGFTFQILTCLLVFAVGIWASYRVSRSAGHPDPPIVVIDEVCGICVTFLGFVNVTPVILALGFILFRILDIFKFPFIRRLETLPKGFGIMLDDVAAGIISNILLRILIAFIF